MTVYKLVHRSSNDIMADILNIVNCVVIHLIGHSITKDEYCKTIQYFLLTWRHSI